MSTLLLLTNALQASTEVLPSLALLPHQIRILPAEVAALVDAPDADAVLLDARRDLVTVRGVSRLIRTTGIDVPLILVLTEGGLTAVNADWGADDVLLDTAGPAEIEARLRLVIGRLATTTSAVRGPSMSTYGGCARSSAPNTRPSSARSATSATGSLSHRPPPPAKPPTPPPEQSQRRAISRRGGCAGVWFRSGVSCRRGVAGWSPCWAWWVAAAGVAPR